MSIIVKLLKIFSQDSYEEKFQKENPEAWEMLDQSEIKSLQECLLGMLRDFDDLCLQYNLKYALIGGNVLGYIRHNGGFIPWDDDIDIIMPRKSYEKLKRIFQKSKMASYYTLRGPGCPTPADYRLIKLYKNDTLMRPIMSKKNAENKVFLDIMPLDYVPQNRLLKRWKGFKSIFWMIAAGCKDFDINGNEQEIAYMRTTTAGKFNYTMRKLVSKMLFWLPLQRMYNNYDQSSSYSKVTDFCTIVCGKLHYFGEIVPCKYYFPFKRIKYAGIDSWMIAEPEKYLRHRYGNYTIIPEPSKRETHVVEELKINL